MYSWPRQAKASCMVKMKTTEKNPCNCVHNILYRLWQHFSGTRYVFYFLGQSRTCFCELLLVDKYIRSTSISFFENLPFGVFLPRKQCWKYHHNTITSGTIICIFTPDIVGHDRRVDRCAGSCTPYSLPHTEQVVLKWEPPHSSLKKLRVSSRSRADIGMVLTWSLEYTI